MCQINYLFVVALVCSLFVSCEKEETSDGTIEIFAEVMSGSNGKVLLDGAAATWVNGDAIRINSTEVAVERRNDRAYISYNAAEDEVTRAVYPASLASGDLTGDNVTINFPAYYHYRTDASGHQLLDLPMAARSSGKNPLQFKHLTGALYVTVTNTATVPLTLQSVTISSNIYQLNGSRNINLDDLENISPFHTTANDTRNTVTLVFDTGYVLPSNEHVKVMLPIMPVGGSGDNIFTVKVKSHTTGQSDSYLYNRSQPSGSDHTLARNQLGYVPVDIINSGSSPVLDQEGNAYVVRTPLEFQLMTEGITNRSIPRDAVINITEDIDMSGHPITTINNKFNSTIYFYGTINGNNHVINNLTINSIDMGSSNYVCALFNQVPISISIKNITLNNLVLKHRGNTSNILKLAGFVGIFEQNSATDTLKFVNCTANINSIDIQGANGSIYFGGIICEPTGAGGHVSVQNCSVSMLSNITIDCVNSSIWYGGMIGYSGAAKTRIDSSSYSGNVTINAKKNIYVGALMGRKNTNTFIARNNNITGSIVTTSVEGTYRYLGKMIGYYTTQSTIDTSGNRINISFELNNTTITPDAFGVNR